MNQPSQGQSQQHGRWNPETNVPFGLITPNPKLKLLDQVREVMRLKHYSLRTERTYCDWIRQHIRFHRMSLREELFATPEAKVEQFLSDLAVNVLRQGGAGMKSPLDCL
jgi:hypothetical protein